MGLNGFNIISMNLKVEYSFLREKQKMTLFYRTVLVKMVFKRFEIPLLRVQIPKKVFKVLGSIVVILNPLRTILIYL